MDRPVDVKTGPAMRAELEKSSRITVISAHGYLGGERFGFCGADRESTLLMADEIEEIGANSMLLIDASAPPAGRVDQELCAAQKPDRGA